MLSTTPQPAAFSAGAIPATYKDHPLKGNWKHYRDLHIEPDWLLIYKMDDAHAWLVQTGTHADIFGT
ncbi:MAG: type II toxin-antitoxin system YafQ family toxin [Nitrosomonadales bacterium]|nr:type II toxin-antitoxin system YafQ family toxin [Nitrosomonadales bacterium]